MSRGKRADCQGGGRSRTTGSVVLGGRGVQQFRAFCPDEKQALSGRQMLPVQVKKGYGQLNNGIAPKSPIIASCSNFCRIGGGTGL